MFIIGHRGARGEAPENTLGGFRYLKTLGILAVELDIQVSADGELVVTHDPFLERTSATQGQVQDKTAAELAGIDVAHRAFPRWPCHEGIPRLTEVMEILADFRHVQFEVKARSEEHARRVADVFPRLWREYGFGERAFTTSFNPRYLQLVKELAPEIPRGFLFEEDFTGDPVAIARELGCRSLGPHRQRCDRELIAQARSAGLIVSTWTVNTAERMLELQEMGVDSIITDVPSIALEVLKP